MKGRSSGCYQIFQSCHCYSFTVYFLLGVQFKLYSSYLEITRVCDKSDARKVLFQFHMENVVELIRGSVQFVAAQYSERKCTNVHQTKADLTLKSTSRIPRPSPFGYIQVD